MNELIKNSYDINIKKIYKDFFYYMNEKIKIIKLKEIPININNKINILKDKRISQIVLTKNKEYFTKYKNEYIILLKINDLDNNIDLEYINIFNIENNLEEKNIIEEYEKQIDELESKIKEIHKDYYIGLAEISVSILNDNIGIKESAIGHNISFDKISKEELNNPLNFIKIDKMYNMANYIKYKFFNDELNIEELKQIIKKIKDEKEYKRFIAHMLYPNYYFESNDKEKVIKKHKKYEKMILMITEK